MKRRNLMSACLNAIFPPVIDEAPSPVRKSRNISQALSRADEQATALLSEVTGEIPFHDTLHDIVESMR